MYVSKKVIHKNDEKFSINDLTRDEMMIFDCVVRHTIRNARIIANKQHTPETIEKLFKKISDLIVFTW